MSQESESEPQLPEPDPFEFIDVPSKNPWWEEETAFPPRTLPRTDLYWRVRNTLENDLVLIPGAPVTGPDSTLQQVVRALLLGAEHEEERIRELFRDDEIGNVGSDGCDPAQICYADCSDPIAYLVSDFVNEVRKEYHTIAAATGELDFYLLLEDVFRLDDWRGQLVETHNKLTEDFPEDWTIVATVPVGRLAHESTFDTVGKVKVDNPHLTQKFRDTLVTRLPELREAIRPVDADSTPLGRARDAFEAAVVGESSPEQLLDDFKTLEGKIRDGCDDGALTDVIDQYLTVGGFEPAIAAASDNENFSSDEAYVPTTEAVCRHVQSGLTTTIYKDVSRLAKVEPDVPRIDNPEEFHAMIAFLARRDFSETSYRGMAATFLDCDPRTIRQKYVPLLEDLQIGERATRYDLERNRTLRFYMRSPGYLTALKEQPVTDEDRTDRLRVTLSDHLRRLLPKYDSNDTLQYWYDDDHLVDFIFDVEGEPVLFVSKFAENTGGTTDAFDAFAEAVQSHNLEVVVTKSDDNVTVKEIDSGRIRLTLPHWLLLSIC